MNKKEGNTWIHGVLDQEGVTDAAPLRDSAERQRLADYREVMADLGESRVRAPRGLADRITAALPDFPPQRGWRTRVRQLWPSGGSWFLPALAGAAAALLVVFGFLYTNEPRAGHVALTFSLHAPDAKRVELLGSFNNWTPGQVVLSGPDATGEWTVAVDLPKGRHEYVFLVDGKAWICDPKAELSRPDGFGRENAVIEI